MVPKFTWFGDQQTGQAFPQQLGGARCTRRGRDSGSGDQPMENMMIKIYATTQKSLVSENETNLVWTAQRSDLEAFN